MGKNIVEIRPQPGPQEAFMATSADVCIYGGAAGGGKTYALLLDPLRHVSDPNFGAVIFRRQYVQITNQGGLWDSANGLYGQIAGAYPRKTPKLHYLFRSGAKINFAHIERDEDCHGWQGSQIVMIGFDELTQFSKYQFFYMLSRNRSARTRIAPYVRATCNPDSESWVAEFISWWIDPETGYPIPERSGVIRWMVRLDDIIYWFDTKGEGVRFAIEQGQDPDEALIMPKSVTFIASTLEDNQILMKNDPGYKANLLAMATVERERLLRGNWKIKAAAGLFFKRAQVTMIDRTPEDIVALCRAWDLAATTATEKGDAAFTASVLLAKTGKGRFVVLNVTNQRLSAGDVRTSILNTCKADHAKYGYLRTRVPQDPGQAGKSQAIDMVNMLQGYDAIAVPESGSKETRAEPVAAQWQQGFFDVMEGPWNEEFFSELESFPEGKFKDMVDALSSAFNEVTLGNQFDIRNLL